MVFLLRKVFYFLKNKIVLKKVFSFLFSFFFFLFYFFDVFLCKKILRGAGQKKTINKNDVSFHKRNKNIGVARMHGVNFHIYCLADITNKKPEVWTFFYLSD